MSIKLSDILKSRTNSLRIKDDKSLREQAKYYANILKEKELERKRELEEEEERHRNALEIAAQQERERIEREREAKTRRYFEFNRIERKVAPPRKPVFYGDLVMRNSSWIAHGKGEFYLDDQIKFEGDFQKGEFVRGRVRWDADGSEWEGALRNSLIHGVGTVVTPEGERKKAIADRGGIICFQEDLTPGRRVRFNEPMFHVWPSQHRTPTATVVRQVRDWVYLLRLDEDVWPKERQIDLSSNFNFTLPKCLPAAYTLHSFGFDAETRRVYDHRHVDKVDRASVRNNAENLLRIASMDGTEANTVHSALSVDSQLGDGHDRLGFGTTNSFDLMGAEQPRSESGTVMGEAVRTGSARTGVSFELGTDDDDDNASAHSTYSGGSVGSYGAAISRSGGGGSGGGRARGTRGGKGPRGGSRRKGAPSGVVDPLVEYLRQQEVDRCRRRLIERFPLRSHNDRTDNFFESRAIGVGAAQEEEEEAIRQELKKQQWQVLIAERRARQEEERQARIEDEQRSIMEQSISEKKKADSVKRQEEEEHSVRTQQAVQDALEELSRASSRSRSRPVTPAPDPDLAPDLASNLALDLTGITEASISQE